MKTKYLFYVRKFLNSKKYHTGAYIIAEITKDIWYNTNKKTKEKIEKVDRNASITLSDCSRSIDLDFNFYNVNESKNSLKKLDVIINTLTEFRKVYVEEMKALKKEKK